MPSELREAAQRLCDAIADQRAIAGLQRDGFGQGWRELADADDARLANAIDRASDRLAELARRIRRLELCRRCGHDRDDGVHFDVALCGSWLERDGRLGGCPDPAQHHAYSRWLR